MSYKPDQRQVPTQIMTQAGWLQGVLHIPRASQLVLHLNTQSEFLRMTSASFMGKSKVVPFISLQRNRVVLLVPGGEEIDVALERDKTESKRIFVLIDGGVLAGTLKLHPGVRVSDFFAKQQGFVLLQDCVLQLGSLNADFFVEERHPKVIINAPRVIAISEEDPLGAADSPPIS